MWFYGQIANPKEKMQKPTWPMQNQMNSHVPHERQTYQTNGRRCYLPSYQQTEFIPPSMAQQVIPFPGVPPPQIPVVSFSQPEIPKERVGLSFAEEEQLRVWFPNGIVPQDGLLLINNHPEPLMTGAIPRDNLMKMAPTTQTTTMNSPVQVASPPPVKSTKQVVPKSPPVKGWWSQFIDHFKSAPQMCLPDDTNPVIIWSEEKGMWVDTTSEIVDRPRATSPPHLTKSLPQKRESDMFNWWGRQLTMEFDEKTGTWIDRENPPLNGYVENGYLHPNNQYLQKLLREIQEPTRKYGPMERGQLDFQAARTRTLVQSI
jgi:hypothetical protein